MPICSYVLAPVKGNEEAFRNQLRALPEQERIERAEDREIYVLVTETTDFDHQQELEDRLQSMNEIEWLVQSFGELVPEAGQVEPSDDHGKQTELPPDTDQSDRRRT